jgi:nucleotide exchange factor SIL1
MMVVWIVPALLLLQRSAHAKEVEATHDWTLLGENDTVAAGMHIRMDLATGQKWVKLPSPDEGGDARNMPAETSRISSDRRQASAASTSSSSAVVVTANGETSSTDNAAETEKDEAYDYDMMHRTLNQLPDEEKARIELPDAPQSGMTTEQRLLFEERMKNLWLQRQEELRRFEQEFVADMPQILRDRIVRLEQYVTDPMKELLEMSSSEQRGTPENTQGADSDSESSTPVVTHIVSVLADLEYHLSDIDMTRDFYTLGGWPMLVSLLHDNTHVPTPNQTAIYPAEHPLPVQDAVHNVQAHAAWALGTAVKNTGEFAPFAVEPLQLLALGQQSAPVSALQVLLDQLCQVDLVDASQPLQNKVHKYLYALGSFVRGNPLAQRQFVALHGPRALEGLVDVHTPALAKAPSRKIVHRAVSIVDDVVRETGDPARQQSDVSDELVRDLATPVWCESISGLLAATATTTPPTASVVHPALRLAVAVAPRCQQTDPDWSVRVRASAFDLLRQWQDEATTMSDEGADLDELAEGVHLAQSVVSVLDISSG